MKMVIIFLKLTEKWLKNLIFLALEPSYLDFVKILKNAKSNFFSIVCFELSTILL